MTVYIIKSSISLMLLFGVYWLLTRKEKLFVFNRFFLVFSILFSLIIPFITIPVNIPDKELEGNISALLNNNLSLTGSDPDLISYSTIQPGIRETQSSPGLFSRIRISQLLLVLYFSGVVVLLFRFLLNLLFISKRARSSENVNYKGHTLVLMENRINLHCFLNKIFVTRSDFENHHIAPELLTHELEHIRQLHSLDIIFLELTGIIYWFNPILILYNREIRINHEYLADNGVLKDSSDVKSYAEKLLNFISGIKEFPLVSGCNHSLTGKRLIMMTKSKPDRVKNVVRIFLTLNLVALVFFKLSIVTSNSQPSNTVTNSNELSSVKSPEYSDSASSGTEKKIKIYQAPVIIQKKVKGIVLKEDGKPLSGVRINNTGTMGNSYMKFSGTDGRFLLYNLEADTYLSFSLQEYKSQSVKADFKSEMIIKLIKDSDYKEPDYENEPKDANSRPVPMVVLDGVVTKEPAAVINSRLGAELGTVINLTGKEATDKYGEAGKNGVTEIYSRKKAAESGIKIPFRRNKPDDYPTFQGADYTSFIDWVVSQMTYPSEAATKGIRGRVTVYYTVESDGTISKVSLMGRPDPLLGDVAIKTVQSSPKWEPAKNQDASDPFSSMIAIKFELPDKIIKDDTYVMSEKRPQYPGGDDELMNFIKANTIYPEALKAEKIEGRIGVRFVINSEGNVEDPTILKGVHPLLDAEAIRVTRKLKGFSPGTQGGKPVNVYYAVMVNFSLPVTEEPSK